MERTVAPAAFTVALALVHAFGGQWQFTDSTQRRRWLSAAGGASVAYVFVLLLPEVSEAALVAGQLRAEALLAEQLVYLLALVGFVAFYGVEVLVSQRGRGPAEEATTVFWLHVAVFALYSGVIGYLLFHQEVPGPWNQFFYALAMGLHFTVTDYGLRRSHGEAFDGIGRWVLAVGTLLGGTLGVVAEVPGLGIQMLFGFVAGALVLNIIKEELPEIDEGRFLAFAAGAAAYTVVLLLV